jgi:TP901 family phage tail tape measure protein
MATKKTILELKTTGFDKSQGDIKKLTAEVDKLKQQMKDLRSEQKKTSSESKKQAGAFSNLGKTMLSIGKAFVIVKGFQALNGVISDAITVTREFELAMAKVGAISGASAEELDKLTESARKLGGSSIFTATQVAELQLALSKLGFTSQEILAASGGIVDLATATGEDLATSADVAASTLRGFNLSAEETRRVVDVMGAAFNSSALDLSNFRQSMKIVAPIANAANIPLEKTTALLGTLANAGLRGSKAATGLKNILSQLSSPTSKLSKELGFTVRNSDDLDTAFEELAKKNIDLAKATGLTDERSKAAFLTMLNGIETTNNLNDALNNAIGTTSKAANEIGDTLDSEIKELTSSWNDLILAIEGSGVARSVVQALTYSLRQMTDGGQQAAKTKKLAEDMTTFGKSSGTSAKRVMGLAHDVSIVEKELERLNNRLLILNGYARGSQQEIRKTKNEIKATEETLADVNKELEDTAKIGLSNYISELEKTNGKSRIFETQLSENIDTIDEYKKAIKELQEELNSTTLSTDKYNKVAARLEKIQSALNLKTDEETRNRDLNVLQLKKSTEAVDFDTISKKRNKKAGDELESTSKKLTKGIEEEQGRAEASAKARREMQIATVEQSAEALSAFADLANTINQNRLIALEQINQQELQNFDRSQDHKLNRMQIIAQYEIDTFKGTEDQKAAFAKQKELEILDAEKEGQRKRDELRKKQLANENKIAKKIFAVDKANTIAQIGVQTALGVAQVNANPAVNLDISQTLRSILTGLVIGTGAAQIAAVGAQKFTPKTFQDGGILSGASHSEGGIPFTVAGRGGFEAEGGEAIINKRSTAMFAPLLSAINQAGGGVAFGNASARPFYQDGGIAGSFSASLDMNNEKLGQVIGEIVSQRIQEIPVINVATDTTTLANRVINAERDSII